MSRTYTSIAEASIPYSDVAIPPTRGSRCLTEPALIAGVRALVGF